MSIKSTHSVTRDFALQAIERKLYGVDDRHLADILETVLHSPYHNFRVVSEAELKADKEKDYHVLDDIEDLPEYSKYF